MKKYLLISIVFFALTTTSCVQKSYKRTVIFNLDVKGIKNIKTVGIRGNDKPLSWDYDYAMTLGKDSIYTATITGETGYKLTEVKFTVNGDLELQDKENRKVYFEDKDRTVYESKFNVLKQEKSSN